MNDPRDNVVYTKTSNKLRANNAKPYRSPNYSNYEYNSYQPNYMHQSDTQFGHTNQTYHYLRAHTGLDVSFYIYCKQDLTNE